MKIGILSDSHDNVPMVDAAVAAFRERGVERVIHAGDFVAPFSAKRLSALDVPIIAVFGNCDGEHTVLSEVLPGIVSGARHETIDGKRFVIVHAAAWLSDEDRRAAEVIVCGHTHEARIDDSGPLLINPGECGGWVTGRATAALLDTETMSPELIELNS